MKQIDLFSGEKLRDLGIKQALDNAGPTWQESAYTFLLKYMESHNQFMCEDVRIASTGFVPSPPHARSWGGIFCKASKTGIIKRIGYRSVKNAKAHCTPAAVWEVV